MHSPAFGLSRGPESRLSPRLNASTRTRNPPIPREVDRCPRQPPWPMQTCHASHNSAMGNLDTLDNL
jgi:hypothetical protein